MDDISTRRVEHLKERAEERLVGLVQKYTVNGPRYTSYPTAAQFTDCFSAAQAADALRSLGANSRPIEVYVHVPFCRERCSFCACTVIATREYERVAVPYVDMLIRECQLVTRMLGRRPAVEKLHLGGGTPTYLSPELLCRLLNSLANEVELTSDAELSIELDPRVTTDAHLDVLQAAGINRVSLGVQDLDAVVQDEIGRHQPAKLTLQLIENLRRRGLQAINVDLVYGLPAQVPESLVSTIDALASAHVERMALYGYAHMPDARRNQREIDSQLLPHALERLELLCTARERVLEHGYELIGMDHFSMPGDKLAVAKQQRTLSRNFMGYTAGHGDALVGLGVSAISCFGHSYAQNSNKLSVYRERLEAEQLPTAKGLWLSRDDLIRARVIRELMCFGQIERSVIRRDFMGLDFDDYFRDDLRRMAPMIEDGLVFDDGCTIELSQHGELFVRNVAMCFDRRSRNARTSYRGPDGRLRLRHSQTV